MPDLKFDGNFYFSANNKVNGNYPLLIPVISNPNFLDSNSKIIPPLGIKEIINGDIGITEKIIMPVLKPSLNVILAKDDLLKNEIESKNNLILNELNNYLKPIKSSYDRIKESIMSKNNLNSIAELDRYISILEKTVNYLKPLTANGFKNIPLNQSINTIISSEGVNNVIALANNLILKELTDFLKPIKESYEKIKESILSKKSNIDEIDKHINLLESIIGYLKPLTLKKSSLSDKLNKYLINIEKSVSYTKDLKVRIVSKIELSIGEVDELFTPISIIPDLNEIKESIVSKQNLKLDQLNKFLISKYIPEKKTDLISKETNKYLTKIEESISYAKKLKTSIISKAELNIAEIEKYLQPIEISVMPYYNNLKAEIMSSNNLKENELYNYLISLYIPKDIGLKPLEMSIISTLLESNKPLIDFLRLFLESIGVAEDIVCRFLGSHIKIAGKDIGFKSRNPLHWSSDLNYAKTINSSLKDMLTIVDSTINTIEESMSSKHPLKKNISLNSNNKQYGNTNNSYYIAYFDEFGNKIDPPKWIKESKWFSKKILNEYGKEISINAPFEQLSDVFNDGVDQLSQINKSVLNGINDSKKEMLKTIQERIDLINNKTEIQYLEKEKQDAVQILDEIVNVMNDVLNGTNKEGNNYIDDDKSKGINSPLLLNEYISKNRASQFRIKYYPEQKSIIQNVVNSNGEAVEPYVNVPTFKVYYKGEYFNVEVPLAFSNQITTKVVESNSLFLDSKRTEIKDLNVIDYYVKNEITSISLNPNNEEKPFENDTVTYFGHDSKNEYLPDSIKRYFLPFEWNEVEEYDIINKRTNQVIRKETEVVPYKIDVENDYELRLIKVINQPLIETGKNSTDSQIKFDDNTIIITKTNYMQFIKYDDVKQFSIDVLSSNTFTYTRYVDETYFYNNRLFLFKKNLVWGNDYIDSDDCEFYRISGIEKNYNKIYKILINIPLVQVDSFTINNITKTITFNFTHGIPDYIINYKFGVNFKIKTPLNNVSIFVYKIESDKIYYKGELKDETVYNVFNVEYLKQTNIQTFQGFNLLKSYSTNLISISDINYTNNLKESDYLLIQGFDNSSFLSTITKRILNEGKDSYKFTQPNKEADNYYKILKIETVKTLKGIDILSLKLDYDIINIYDNKFYSYTDKLQFYYPLRFYPLSQLNNLIISNTETGTIFTDNNNIPKDSTPDINTENLLKEGIIYQGLDTRFIDRNKWKYFYLIEAVKKEDNGLAKINNSFNAKELSLLKTTIELGTGKGKEWYGLLDKFTVTPMIVNQLIPIISKKMIPLFVKVINTISNPAKIKELLLELAVVNEDISKIPKNIKFLKKKERDKLKYVNNKGNEKDFTKRQKSLLYYNGVQERKNPLFTFDGKALAEFGLGTFGKSLFKFGIEIKNGEINIISSKDSDSQDQTIFTMILNMVKLPFEVLIKIFKWLLKWIKKLLIPSGIAKALKEFLSFEWLKEILSKESILGILGLSDIEAIFNKLKDIIMNNNTSDLQKKYNELLNFYSGGSSSEYVEVFIYDILKNGIKVGQDIEKKPYNSESVKDNSVNGGNIGDVIKNPFIGGSGDMNYSNLQLGQIFIKPLEMLHSIINLIQEFINGLIEIISSILGLDSLKLPKFGEQIPFANILKDIIEDIRKYEIKLQV